MNRSDWAIFFLLWIETTVFVNALNAYKMSENPSICY